MKTVRISAFVALIFLITACATLDVPVPQTFNQRVLAAYNTADAIVQSMATLLQAGKIKPADAQQVHDQVVNLKTGIDIAQQVHASDPSAGEDKLATTVAALTALQSYLAGRK